MARVWRFLLDQNFPSPVIDVHALDKTVVYEALKNFDVALTKRATPDWLIYLSASSSGRFDGVVTRDKSQLDNAEELVALQDTKLSVVTWRHPIEDPIKEWGQLLAYMPLVTGRMKEHEAKGGPAPYAFFLPRPALGGDNVKAVRALLGEMAPREKRSVPEVGAEARRAMREELRVRQLDPLGDQLA